MRNTIIKIVLLMLLASGVIAQKYEGSWYWNDLYDRYEFKKGMFGEVQGTMKWNSLYDRWDCKSYSVVQPQGLSLEELFLYGVRQGQMDARRGVGGGGCVEPEINTGLVIGGTVVFLVLLFGYM